MMHLLQAHVSVQHYKASLPSYPYGIQTGSSPSTVLNTGMPFNLDPTFPPNNDPGIQEGHSQRSVAPGGHWNYSGATETQTERRRWPRSSSPPVVSGLPLSVNSASRSGLCHSSESMTTRLWTRPSPLSASTGFQGGSPGLAPHAGYGDSDSRHLSASPTTISQSQPTLCLQPSSDGDEHSCLSSGAPTGTSTHSLLDSSPNSHPQLSLPSESHLNSSQASHEDICVLVSATTSHNLIKDISLFQIEDPRPSVHPVSASPPILPGHPLGSSLDSASPQSDALEPDLPLGDPSAEEHTSLECLLGNGSSMESRDSESVSSRRSSIGVQTQSTEQSWCLDLTD